MTTNTPQDSSNEEPDSGASLDARESRPSDRPAFSDLEAALGSSAETLSDFLEDAHPADLAEWLEELDEWQGGRVFEALGPIAKGELLSFADEPLARQLIQRMAVPQIVATLEHLAADDVVDLLALTDPATYEEVLRSVDLERATGLRQLGSYDAETAGGLMTTEFVAVPEGAHVSDAIKLIKAEEGPASEEGAGVFVIDKDGKPVGFVSDRELLTTQIHTLIADVMEEDVITVGVEDDQEDVAHQVLKYSVAAVGVVDTSGKLVGVVHADDAQEVLEEELEEDLLRIVGTSPTEQTRLPVWVRVRHRLPLMGLTVMGGLLSAKILQLALSDDGAVPGETSTVSILRYLPIIIGLAGNVGIQSSTILVRAFATDELTPERENSVLGAEVLVGWILSMFCGATTAVVAMYMEGTADAPAVKFGLAVGLAISVAMTWAGFLGCAVTSFCRRVGIDPAIAAGPFLITLSDISGAAIFVGIATVAL